MHVLVFLAGRDLYALTTFKNSYDSVIGGILSEEKLKQN